MRRRALLLALLAASCDRPVPPAASPPPPPVPSDADRFSDTARPYAERVEALRALRAKDPAVRRDAYARLRERLWEEAGHADRLSMNDLEEQAFVESLSWHAEERDETARVKIELYLDREFVKRKPFRESTRGALALALANYPASESARETLWAGLRDRSEAASARSACLKALQAFHPKDLEERVVALPAAPGDDWLRELQGKLR